MEYNATAALGELPRGLAAGQSPTDNVNRPNVMNRHALRIAPRSRADRHLFLWMSGVFGLAACSSGQANPEVNVPSSDQAWVASACDAASIDTTGWRRHRLGDITIAVPAEYRFSSPDQYQLVFRGPRGTLVLSLHRDARYSFDAANSARRGQNWCNGNLGGNQAEILSWFEPFDGIRRDTRAGELQIGAAYNFVARLPATWGGQDEGKWLFAQVGASRLRDAHVLRDALHTLSVVRDTGFSR